MRIMVPQLFSQYSRTLIIIHLQLILARICMVQRNKMIFLKDIFPFALSHYDKDLHKLTSLMQYETKLSQILCTLI